MPVRFEAEYEPQFEGYHSRVRDNRTRSFVLRMVYPWQAESTAWIWNMLESKRTVAALDSPFQAMAANGDVDFYDGATPTASPRV